MSDTVLKLIFTFFILCSAVISFAGEMSNPEWSLNAGVGPNLTQLDAIGDELKSSVGGALWLSREWDARSRFDITFDYFDFEGSGRNYPGLSAAYGLRFFTDSQLKPFLLVGAGAGKANNFPRAVNKAQDTFHFFARTGVKEIWAGKRWALGLIYDFLNVDLDDKPATSAQLGLPMVSFTWKFSRDNEPPAPTPVVRVDSDRDGVYDDKDDCPDTPRGSRVNSIGCLPKQKVTKTLKVEFDTNKYFVKEQYYPIIDAFGKFMNDNPDLDVVVEGHTDSVGSRQHNLKLSANRAAAVKDAIVARTGVDPSRLQSQGFGPDKPIASNATTDGKSRNRRVVAVLSSM